MSSLLKNHPRVKWVFSPLGLSDLAVEQRGTLVRETWDISQEAGLSKPLVARGRDHTVENMEKTLARIQELVTA